MDLSRQEAEEVFRILRDKLDYRIDVHQKVGKWPLYDRFAAELGENSSEDHIEYRQLKNEEYREDERLSRIREEDL